MRSIECLCCRWPWVTPNNLFNLFRFCRKDEISFDIVAKTAETDPPRPRPRPQVSRLRPQNSGLETKTAVPRTISQFLCKPIWWNATVSSFPFRSWHYLGNCVPVKIVGGTAFPRAPSTIPLLEGLGSA